MQISAVVLVIVCAEQVHALEELVQENKRTDKDQAAKDAPAPEGAGTERIIDASALELIADAAADPVLPDDIGDAERDRSDDKEEQTEVHGLFVVKSAGDGVDVTGNICHADESVNAERDCREKNAFEHTAVCSEHNEDFLSCDFQ